MNKSIISWNQIYKSGKSYTPFNQVLFDKVFNSLTTLKTALDIGCGEGELVTQLEKKGLHVTGIDLSSTAIELAKQKTDTADFIVGDITEYTGGPFDLITCKLVLPFIKDRGQFIKKIISLLSDKGIFLLYVPVRKSNYSYSKHYKNISVDYHEMTALLQNYFSKITEVAEDYHGKVEFSVVILCYK